MKKITVLFFCLSIIFSANCLAKDLNQGKIIGNLDEKVKIMTGDEAIIDLGRNNGVTKGDILTIYNPRDIKYLNPIGKCAIVQDYERTSICEIIKIYNNEIGMDMVVLDKLIITDPDLYPVIFQLLTKVVEPYEAQKEITVYVHSIFDEQNNVTKFSEKIQREIKKIFVQKKRINVEEKNLPQSLFAYLPDDYAESNQVIEDYLKKGNIDVLIAGTYKMRGDKIELSLYKVDKNYEDIAVDTTLNAATYASIASSVVTSYKPIKKEQNIVCDILYTPIHHKITLRDERNNIVDIEAKNNPFLEYTLKRVDFNIISPTDFKLIVDNNEISFEKTKNNQISMNTGRHEITAVFKKGFYSNDLLVYPSDIEVKKDIVLILDKPGDIKIEVSADAMPGKENIDFKIYKKTDMSRSVIKQVGLERNNIKSVETFKD